MAGNNYQLNVSEAVGQAAAPECDESKYLLQAYQAAVEAFGRVLQMLVARSGTIQRDEYEKIRGYSEMARLKSECARTELDRHIAEHGC